VPAHLEGPRRPGPLRHPDPARRGGRARGRRGPLRRHGPGHRARAAGPAADSRGRHRPGPRDAPPHHLQDPVAACARAAGRRRYMRRVLPTSADWSEPMFFRDACIPIRLGWSSPFARWQVPLAEAPSLDLAVQVPADALADRGLPATEVTGIVLGWTVPQPEIFYGASTVAARIGAPHATGAMLSQACATSAACMEAAALRVEAGLDELSVVITTDRTSNGPVLTYPAPSAPRR